MKLSDLPLIETIEFQGVSFAHENYDPTFQNCDFEFKPGAYRIQSIEGAGKSTLLQIFAGLLIPQSGKYLINGQDVAQMSFEEFLPYRLRIGYTFDYGGLINNRTIFENLTLPLVYHKLVDEHEARDRVDRMLVQFRVQRYRDERPAHVPGRVRKLAVLLRALVIEPHVLLLDDPSVGLSDDTQKVFLDHIELHRSEGTLPYVFMASYDDVFLQQIRHETLHIDSGLIYDCLPYKEAASL